MPKELGRLATAITWGFLCVLAQAEPLVVSVSRGPGKSWKELPTRVLGDLPEIALDEGLGVYGGRPTLHLKASGFYQTTFQGGRWWLVDPEGRPYLNRGVTSVRETRTSGAQEQRVADFGSREGWAQATADLLRKNGFNSLGPWSDEEPRSPRRFPAVEARQARPTYPAMGRG